MTGPAANAQPSPEEPVEWAGSQPLRHVYDPSTKQEPNQYLNDHTVIKGHDGQWHLYSIVGDKAPPGEFPDPALETKFAHATAPSLNGPWTTQPYALTVDPNYFGEDRLWAPHVVEHNGTYYMFYAGGGSNDRQWAMSVATSKDLFHWTRLPSGPLFRDFIAARDPHVKRVGDEWVMYYTANSAPDGGNHVVAARTSRDLVHWGPKRTVFADPTTAANNISTTESPTVVRRGDWWYLFIGPRGGYVGTDIYRSRDPLRFDLDDYAGHVPVHAAEVAVDQGRWTVTGAGSYQRGLYVAPLEWREHPPVWASRRNPALARNTDGTLELFATSSSGELLHRAQSAPGTWGAWENLGGPPVTVPVTTSLPDGRLAAFAVRRDNGRAVIRTQTAPGGTWGQWQDFGADVAAAPSVLADDTGRLHAFALSADASTQLHRAQVSPGGAWGGWENFAGSSSAPRPGGPVGSPPIAARNADGRIEVFAVGRAGHYAAHRWQRTPGGDWAPWADFDGPTATVTPSVAQHADGRLEVNTLDNGDINISSFTQRAPGGEWGKENDLGTAAEAVPEIATNTDGRMERFVTLPDGVGVRHQVQEKPNGAWTDRGWFSGRTGCGPSVTAEKDGRLTAIAVKPNGDGLMSRTQVSSGGDWGPWQDFATPGQLGGLPCGDAR